MKLLLHVARNKTDDLRVVLNRFFICVFGVFLKTQEANSGMGLTALPYALVASSNKTIWDNFYK